MPRAVAAVPDPNQPDEEQTPPPRLVTVDYEGHTYTYDIDKVTIQALEDYDDGKYIAAVRAILGAEQWAAFKSRHPFGVDLDRFIAALLAATGSLGNSSASSAS